MKKSNKKILNDVVGWDVINWSQALPFWLHNTSLDLTKSKAIEIGSNGGIALWISDYCKEVDCTNVKDTKKKADWTMQKYKTKNIKFFDLDIFESNFEEEYDIIITKSVLTVFSKEKQELAIAKIHKALKKGGEFWFVENLKSTPFHQFCRKHFVSWSHYCSYFDAKKVNKKFAAFDQVQFTTFGFLGTFGRNNLQRDFLGIMDKYFFDKIVPTSWNYIVSGIAKK